MFGRPQFNQGANPLQALAQVKRMMNGSNPQAVYEQMLKTNPQFERFVRSIQGKDLNELAKANGIDLDLLKSLLE